MVLLFPERLIGLMAARQCPGLRSKVTIEYSEFWAMARLCDKTSRLRRCDVNRFDARASPAHGLDRSGRHHPSLGQRPRQRAALADVGMIPVASGGDGRAAEIDLWAKFNLGLFASASHAKLRSTAEYLADRAGA